MKLLAQLVTSALATAVLAAPGQWVEVGAGSWRPQKADLAAAEAAFRPLVEAAAKAQGAVHAWQSYTFQYQGRLTTDGKRYIYVNAFCDSAAQHDLKNWVTVFDGGVCFFRGSYDPTAQRVHDLGANGVAYRPPNKSLERTRDG